jgi:rSAM/selenodomain-associated transferase 2
VIIPTLNEKGRLGEQIGFLLQHEGVEVIIADGGSDDGTEALARRLGAVTVSSPRGRATQMNAGAHRASGGILLFLHADTFLPGDFGEAVRESVANGAVGGAFRFSLDEEGAFLKFITMTANFRSSRMGIVFGDQAIFARSDSFAEAGGFPRQPLMEDYELIRRLRRLGKVEILDQKAVTSARRWREVGPVRNSLVNVAITWAYVLGVGPARLQRWHRRLCREDRREEMPRRRRDVPPA